MASHSFGNLFKMTTWGESHGQSIGVVIDGCPAGLEITEQEIRTALAKRLPGKNPYTSPRKELDLAQILSGVFEGKTTGMPISILIPNQDVDSSKYEPIKEQLRPGHANYTYLKKYGIFDYRGGGRASGRETACRVAAGAIAEKLLSYYGIFLFACIKQIGNVKATIDMRDIDSLSKNIEASSLWCPDVQATAEMIEILNQVKNEGNSLGGLVEFIVIGAPVGLGDPVYEKLEANLAYAMMGLPSTKGFEIGSGFDAVSMKGSEHNDLFIKDGGKVVTKTNHSGGVLGGISNGMPIVGRVAFKPTSSITKVQETLTVSGEVASFQLPEGSRHDPCIAIRAVPVVKAMLALVLADALLMNRSSRL